MKILGVECSRKQKDRPMPPPAMETLQAEPTNRSELSLLVVDDSRAQRRMLSVLLGRWGYRVTEAGSGEEALDACAREKFDIILSDWMMDGISGLEFCNRLRRMAGDTYSYFILLTSKSEKAEIADGLEAGADDFLTKPVAPGELRARLRAGERIIGMQAELLEKNRLLGSTLTELQRVHDALDRDLLQARAVQQTFMRERRASVPGGDVSILFQSSGHVGGDLVGWFRINTNSVILYSIDVSGHGVASAMLSARLAGLLSGAAPERNAAIVMSSHARRETWAPEDVAQRFNRLILDELKVDQYMTMVYVQIDLLTGKGRLVQAGHPHPVILRRDGGFDRLGQGGLPVGLLEEASFTGENFVLLPGDRLFLMTDGITECPDPAGEELGEDGLLAMLTRHRAMPSGRLLEALVWDLAKYLGSDEFPDDVSGLIFDYNGI